MLKPDQTINIKSFTVSSDKLNNVLRSEIIVAPAHPHCNSSNFKYIKYGGIWDTGATASVISEKVSVELDLDPIGFTDVLTAGGHFKQPVYLINLILPNGVGFENLAVTQGNIAGTDLLIGMDVINKGDFAVTNYENQTTFTFRIPSIEKIDFVIQKPAVFKTSDGKKAINIDQIPRRQPCPCGSGKKYKDCCEKTSKTLLLQK